MFSIPNIRGLISRSSEIKVKAQAIDVQLLEKTVHGFEARIIQHECDHLNGILFPMKMTDMRTLIYTEN